MYISDEYKIFENRIFVRKKPDIFPCPIDDYIQEKTAREKETIDEDSAEKDFKDTLDLEMTPIEAYILNEKFEHFFLKNIPEKIDVIWQLKDCLKIERKSRTPKITDFIVRKQKKTFIYKLVFVFIIRNYEHEFSWSLRVHIVQG